jgi:hypothetical protein
MDAGLTEKDAADLASFSAKVLQFELLKLHSNVKEL